MYFYVYLTNEYKKNIKIFPIESKSIMMKIYCNVWSKCRKSNTLKCHIFLNNIRSLYCLW